ncbi:MAG: hypothetical protein PVJ57_11965 [Phycisphaerae bacterium]
MKTGKWALMVLASGLLFGIGSCASDLGYYAVDTLAAYLPDLLEAWLGTAASA